MMTRDRKALKFCLEYKIYYTDNLLIQTLLIFSSIGFNNKDIAIVFPR